MRYVYRKVKKVYEDVYVRSWWFFGKKFHKSVVVGYDRDLRDRIHDEWEWSEEAQSRLENYFQFNPPKVGDIIYVECPYKIVKVFYNLNHDRMEIWISEQIGLAEERAPI